MAEPTPRVAAVAGPMCGQFCGTVLTPCQGCIEEATEFVAALDAYDAVHPDEVPWLEWGGGRGYDLFRVRVRPETGAEQ